MNYLKLHDSIVTNAQLRQPPYVGYELHHITPMCEGGQRTGPTVPLTRKEHRVIHLLRYKINHITGNYCAYNLMRFGRGALSDVHRLVSSLGGIEHHKQYRARDPLGYIERQRQSGKLAGIKSRDLKLGFHALTPDQKKVARDRGRLTTVSHKLGMFDDEYRRIKGIKQQKRVLTPDGIFDSMTAAAEFYSVTQGTITYRVSSDNWKKWSLL
jgi:hypothetical protein